MKRITVLFLGVVVVAVGVRFAWPEADEEGRADGRDRAQLPPIEEDPAYQRLQEARKKPLVPMGGTPEQRRRALEQQKLKTMARLEAEARARRELDNDVPERLEELSPLAAEQLRRHLEVQDKWQEHRREQLRQLERIEPLVEGEVP